MALLPLHQILICGTHVLLQSCQFWTQLQKELVREGPYQQASISGMRLRLPELQAEDLLTKKIRKQGLKDSWEEDIDEVF